ncbi:MAG TPA: hypothetical protein VK897_27690 [Anaerolineales bacterium]|nr:hypothetical protein [Anaerolineales bacterium]
MVLKTFRSLIAINLILILVAALLPVDQVHALSTYEKPGSLPLLNEFISQMKNGQAGELRGIYIPEILAAPVVQQPAANNAFVSPIQNIVTQFSLAAQYSSTGLLAHNYLAGEKFLQLKEDQKFYLIYGDGQVFTFVITEILRYQALEPSSTSSNFVSLENDELLSASDLFYKVYQRSGDVILQTCISKDDNLSWGRLFVIAEPVDS